MLIWIIPPSIWFCIVDRTTSIGVDRSVFGDKNTNSVVDRSSGHVHKPLPMGCSVVMKGIGNVINAAYRRLGCDINILWPVRGSNDDNIVFIVAPNAPNDCISVVCNILPCIWGWGLVPNFVNDVWVLTIFVWNTPKEIGCLKLRIDRVLNRENWSA